METPAPSQELKQQARRFRSMHEVCRDIRFEHDNITYRLLVVRYYIETGLWYTTEDMMMDENGEWTSADLPDVHMVESEEVAIRHAFGLICNRWGLHD